MPGVTGIKLLTITELRGRPEAEILSHLHDRGMEVRVLAPPHSTYGPLLSARQVAVEPWACPRVWDVAGLRDLSRALSLFRPDLIVLRGAAITVPVLTLSARSGAPLLLFVDRFEGDQLPGLLARVVADRFRVAAVVLDIAAPDQAHSAAGRISVIGPGHDPAWYPAGPHLATVGIPERAFTVGAMAGDAGDDQLALLIDAARWLPMDLPIHFLLIARPQDHGHLRHSIRKNPFPQRFHLADDFGDAPALMAQCDLLAALRWRTEPLRRTVLHCLHHGVPCIAEDGLLVREVIKPGVSGLVVPSQEPGALAEALAAFYEHPEQREQLREGALREAGARFTMNRVLQQFDEVCQRALARS